MSDLELVLEEIEALQGVISAAIYIHKKNGNIEALEEVIEALNLALGGIPIPN